MLQLDGLLGVTLADFTLYRNPRSTTPKCQLLAFSGGDNLYFNAVKMVLQWLADGYIIIFCGYIIIFC